MLFGLENADILERVILTGAGLRAGTDPGRGGGLGRRRWGSGCRWRCPGPGARPRREKVTVPPAFASPPPPTAGYNRRRLCVALSTVQSRYARKVPQRSRMTSTRADIARINGSVIGGVKLASDLLADRRARLG